MNISKEEIHKTIRGLANLFMKRRFQSALTWFMFCMVVLIHMRVSTNLFMIIGDAILSLLSWAIGTLVWAAGDDA